AVGFDLVIAGCDPDFAAIFDTQLRRTEHMASRMKRQLHVVVLQRMAIWQDLQGDLLTEPRTQQAFARRRCQIVAAAGSRMVAVRMGNHRALDRTPWIDEKLAG